MTETLTDAVLNSTGKIGGNRYSSDMVKPSGTGRVHCLVARLQELIEALDRRTPRPERMNESRIAAESATLREQALERIAELDTCQPS